MATYTNLPKGDYVFKVRSTNAEGVWTENTRLLDIEVLPSFWETPFAYFLYVLFVLLIIVTAVYILFTIYRLKHEVSVEQQMTNMKLRFFTDISHELRTPLTLISGPVEYVLSNKRLPADVREQLQVVERNTNRMLHLINQILDFRKIQNKKMKMQVQRVDVVAFTRKVMENFDSVAEEHRIDFLFETEKPGLYLWIDADKYEKIIFNLLSNAFKYTPNGKMIKVFIHEDKDTVSIGVQDQGIGIAENKKKSIFVRFENMVDRNLFNPSTGIGLSLVKELVEMHKALISVDSKLGEGSCFKIDFQKGKEHYDDSVEFMQDDATVCLEVQRQQTEETVSPQSETEREAQENEDMATSKGLMLLVEDNAELRIFLRSIFSPEYRIVEAADGMEGCDKALKLLPDIIISDVMMPRMNGYELCKNIKEDITISHIPIVLLTARDDKQSQLSGYKNGADAYLTKPFEIEMLMEIIRNRLKNRESIKKRYLNTGLVPAPEESTFSQADETFLLKLNKIILEHLDSSYLDVTFICKEIGMSRASLYNKLKALTDMGANDYINKFRMEKAITLITSTDLSFTEIAEKVGFTTSRYFSTAFKQYTGETPTQYKEKQKQERKKEQ